MTGTTEVTLPPLKQKHRALWALGDYPAVASEVIAELGEVLVEACEIDAGDLVLDVGRHPVHDAQGIQKQLFGDAVGVPLPVTVLRNGAMVDVVAVPTELG